MIPSIPNDFSPESREGELFISLQKLPDDYYVFHSFRIINIVDNEWKENEIDFVLFNKQKELLCIEAKAGKVSCQNGIWYYAPVWRCVTRFNKQIQTSGNYLIRFIISIAIMKY